MGVVCQAWTWTKSALWEGQTWLNVLAWAVVASSGVVIRRLVSPEEALVELTSVLWAMGALAAAVPVFFLLMCVGAVIQQPARKEAERERVHRKMVAQAVEKERQDESSRHNEALRFRLRLRRVIEQREKGETLLSELRKNPPRHAEPAEPRPRAPHAARNWKPYMHPPLRYAKRISDWWTFCVANTLGGTPWRDMLPSSKLNLRPEQEEGELEAKLKTLGEIIELMKGELNNDRRECA